MAKLSDALSVIQLINDLKKYEGKIVTVDVWRGLLDNLIDGCSTFPQHLLGTELSKMFLAGEEGTLYFEPMTAKERDSYVSWIGELYDEDPESFHYGDKAEMMENFIEWDFLQAANPDAPEFVEFWCDEAPLTKIERMQLVRDSAPAHVLAAREASKSLPARWKSRYG